MHSFEGIIEFVAVVECQGFSAAATQLNCSPSHVSRQVSRLEKRLGCTLLARSTRMVNLTQSGQHYFIQCKELVSGLNQANEQVTSQQIQLRGTLKVSAAGAFAEQFVAPTLIEFARKHNELSIDMDFNSRKVNFIDDGVDFAIRYGKLHDSGLVARKLLNRPLMAVASPAYLEKHAPLIHPQDLKRHSCIVSNNQHWQFEHDGDLLVVKVQGRWQSNNVHALIAACEAGLGVAYMPKTNFTSSLANNKLVPVLEPYWGKGVYSWIVYQNRQFLPIRARMAIDYLLEKVSHWQESN